MKKILLTQGKYAIVDDEDYDRLNQHTWYASKKRSTWYSMRDIWNSKEKKKIRISMHREIMNVPVFDGNNYIDHKNHNGLDNRKENLRICTNSDNMLNMKKGNGSIWYDRTRDKWAGQLCIRYKKYSIRRAPTKEIAEQRMNTLKQSILRG